MEKKEKASVASVLGLLILFFFNPQSAQAAPPAFSTLPTSGMGISEAIGYWTGITEKLGSNAEVVILGADRAIPVISIVIALVRAEHAGEVASKQGYGFTDGAIDNLIFQAGMGLVPGYIQTNQTMITALEKLGNDPSLDGSYLAEAVRQGEEQSEQQQKAAAEKRRAAEEELGKELYGPSYKLPAGYQD